MKSSMLVFFVASSWAEGSEGLSSRTPLSSSTARSLEGTNSPTARVLSSSTTSAAPSNAPSPLPSLAPTPARTPSPTETPTTVIRDPVIGISEHSAGVSWSLVLPLLGVIAYAVGRRSRSCFCCSADFWDMVPSEIVVSDNGNGSFDTDSLTVIELATITTREESEDWTGDDYSYVEMEDKNQTPI